MPSRSSIRQEARTMWGNESLELPWKHPPSPSPSPWRLPRSPRPPVFAWGVRRGVSRQIQTAIHRNSPTPVREDTCETQRWDPPRCGRDEPWWTKAWVAPVEVPAPGPRSIQTARTCGRMTTTTTTTTATVTSNTKRTRWDLRRTSWNGYAVIFLLP